MVIENFKDFLSENAISSLADNKSEKLKVLYNDSLYGLINI